MRRWRSALVAVASAVLLSSCDLQSVLNNSGGGVGLSDSDVVKGLKESLVLGSKTAALDLGQVDGYLKNELVRIILPDTVEAFVSELERMESQLSGLLKQSAGQPVLSKQASGELQAAVLEFSAALSVVRPFRDSIVTALNRGAEQAAPRSVDVFADAIWSMNLTDARSLLSSSDSVAVTGFLHHLTYNGLNAAFRPILKEPLDYINPNRFWTPIASNYNRVVGLYRNFSGNPLIGNALPAPKYNSAPTDLSDFLATYGTAKALDGLFFMVGTQETKLRADPWGALAAVGSLIVDSVKDLIGKVFENAGS